MRKHFFLCILAVLAVGCGRDKIKPDFDDSERKNKSKDGYLFGKELKVTFGGDEASGASGDALWKGALNALSEYPLAVQNFQVRIIQTDWIYKTQENRYKAIVRLKSEKIVEDEVDIQVIMETKSAKGDWLPVASDKTIAEGLRASILSHAKRVDQPTKPKE